MSKYKQLLALAKDSKNSDKMKEKIAQVESMTLEDLENEKQAKIDAFRKVFGGKPMISGGPIFGDNTIGALKDLKLTELKDGTLKMK